MKSSRQCFLKGHEDIQPTHICILEECNQPTKWVCAVCIVEELHQHGQSSKDHLKRQQDFSIFIQKLQQIQKDRALQQMDLIQEQLLNVKSILESCQVLISQLKQFYINIKQDKQILQIIDLSIDDFHALENDRIDLLIKMNKLSLQWYQDYYLFQLQKIIKYCLNLQKIAKTNNNSVVEQNKLPNQELLQQQIYQTYFYERERQEIYTFEISPNNEIIAYGGYRKELSIFNFLSKQRMKVLKCNNYLMKCKFSNDSNLVFCGDYSGYIYCFNIQKNFEQIYKHKIHVNLIYDIKTVNNQYAITCSGDRNLIVTDILAKNQFLKIENAHKDEINSIEYNHLNQIIISSSYDKSIKFYLLMNGRLLLSKFEAHQDMIEQIQLTYNNNKLISRTTNELIIWDIDYMSKQLNQIKYFKEQDKLYSFQCLENDSIIKIYSNYLLILDQNDCLIKKLQHNIKDFLGIFQLIIQIITSILPFKLDGYHEFYYDNGKKGDQNFETYQMIVGHRSQWK